MSALIKRIDFDPEFEPVTLFPLIRKGVLRGLDQAKEIIAQAREEGARLKRQAAEVLEAAVVAKPDAKWGETPCAFVRLKPGREGLTAQDLITHCRDLLAHFKCPRHVVFMELPKTATGKIQKFKLRELARDI